QLVDGRPIHSSVSLAPALREKTHEAIFGPGQKRFARKEGGDGESLAVDFAALDREGDLAAAGVAGNMIDFRADGFIENSRHDIIGTPDACRAALESLSGSDHISDVIEARIRAAEERDVISLKGSEPVD